jgi:tetratricopeptide (TPR) repeat protein
MNKIAKIFSIISFILCLLSNTYSQNRFIKRAYEALLEKDFAGSMENIIRFNEKNPTHPYSFFLKARWFAHPDNPAYQPDYAYSQLDSAQTMFETADLTKLEKDNTFQEYKNIHEAQYIPFKDSLAFLSFQFIEKFNTIEKYEYYAQKYASYGYATIAKRRLQHLKFIDIRTKDQLQDYVEFSKKYPLSEDLPQVIRRIHEIELVNHLANDNAEYIKEYIRKYPNSHLKDSAWASIHRLEFLKAVKTNNLNAIQNYIKSYPASRYIKQAEEILYLIAFNEAKSENRSDAMRNYRNLYPSSPYVNNALNIEMKLAWIELSNQPSLKGAIAYLNEYPNSPYVNDIANMEANLYFQEIKDSEDPDVFETFINKYSASPKISEAVEKLCFILVTQAEEYLNNEEYDNCVEKLNEIFNYNSDYINALYLRAKVYLSYREYNQAYDYYTRCILKNPRFASAYAERGYSLLNLDNNVAAYSDFKSALNIDNQNAMAFYGLGLYHENREEYSIAIEYYKKSQLAGFDVRDKIDYLYTVQQRLKDIQQYNNRKYTTQSNNTPTKKLILPKSTLNKLKTIKKN